ncbi:MAG: class I SAM-dependent methyltransferase [Rubrivivax sp.]|nr:class I SAM-dependent methyltransferase [Rubrivivax sp.]
MTFRSSLLFALSRWRLPAPAKRTVDYGAYQDWRRQSLSASWSSFADAAVHGKDVLDFGCGDGALSLFLAAEKSPRSVVGVDLQRDALDRAREALARTSVPRSVHVDFVQGTVDGMPLPEASVDVVVAFDCLEHVMAPLPILQEWHRVLRPGGRCLLEWFPFKGPWGPHMESLIPVPWAHVIFGERAMFRAAEQVYDLPEFVPRHWDLDADGRKKPNKWRQWSSFKEQGYVNELDIRSFRSLVGQAGLEIERLETRSFGGGAPRRVLGRMLMSLPLLGEYFVSYTVIQLVKR